MPRVRVAKITVPMEDDNGHVVKTVVTVTNDEVTFTAPWYQTVKKGWVNDDGQKLFVEWVDTVDISEMDMIDAYLFSGKGTPPR